ncbi:hypothetical protein EYF80_045473 [Liparis tanakae]|uniref:Uncharacterized protein n=1 Tax=Liparis tanakae TaxID=230148 RepID=A0A4Z2FTW4_9TELE|nr:hypothetical protein EYF80_045473 [Liparis tanakae]
MSFPSSTEQSCSGSMKAGASTRVRAEWLTEPGGGRGDKEVHKAQSGELISSESLLPEISRAMAIVRAPMEIPARSGRFRGNSVPSPDPPPPAAMVPGDVSGGDEHMLFRPNGSPQPPLWMMGRSHEGRHKPAPASTTEAQRVAGHGCPAGS